MSEKENEVTEMFERVFAGTLQHLHGSEQEIVIFKANARQWFDLGVQYASDVFYKKMSHALTDVRADVDKHFAFLNNR